MNATEKFNPEYHHRQSIRMTGYDYTQCGAYFVTVSAHIRNDVRTHRRGAPPLPFGNVVNGQMVLNEYGEIVVECWQWLAEQYSYVKLDEFVVMPDHFHGILIITDGAPGHDGSDMDGSDMDGSDMDGSGRGGSRTAPTGTDPIGTGQTGLERGTIKRKPLGRLIGAFKTVSTKRINQLRAAPGQRIWQRNYFERVIRTKRELNHTRRYIAGNPGRWGDT